MKISVIGVGPGLGDYLLPIAKNAIRDADCLIGAKRHLDTFNISGKKQIIIEGHIDKIIPYLKKNKNKEKIAVLVSGDPGIFSLLEKIRQHLKLNEFSVIPGISSLQLAFAKIGESWIDAKIISLHGRVIQNLARQIRFEDKVFLFTDQNFPPQKIARDLLGNRIENRRAVILENLSYPNERIIDTDLKRLSTMKSFGLCVMIIKKYAKKIKKGKLYGLGIGPGDPGLVTIKAQEILNRVDTIFVPKSNDDGESLAQSIIKDITKKDKNYVELTFPMTKDSRLLNKYWKDAAKKVEKLVSQGKETAFVTIGDPFIYSTYIYLLKMLRKNHPNVEIETVPGISAFNAAASRINSSLVEGNQKLAVIPVTEGLEGIQESLEEFDTVVLMKVGSKLNKIISLLRKLNLLRSATLISRVGHKDEKIIYDLGALRDKKAGYLSIIIVKKSTFSKDGRVLPAEPPRPCSTKRYVSGSARGQGSSSRPSPA